MFLTPDALKTQIKCQNSYFYLSIKYSFSPMIHYVLQGVEVGDPDSLAMTPPGQCTHFAWTNFGWLSVASVQFPHHLSV